jgi:hypothetical protein
MLQPFTGRFGDGFCWRRGGKLENVVLQTSLEARDLKHVESRERNASGFRLKRPRLRLGLPVEARRNGAADTFEAGEHNEALARTGRAAPELDLKGPEQSLEFRQREVSQLAAGDDPRRECRACAPETC